MKVKQFLAPMHDHATVSTTVDAPGACNEGVCTWARAWLAASECEFDCVSGLAYR